jgi:hypothetical protein
MISVPMLAVALLATQFSSNGSEAAGSPMPTNVVDKLQNLWQEKPLSYQRLLRLSSHLVQSNYVGLLWTDVERKVREANIRQILGKDEQYTTHYEYLIRQDIKLDRGRMPHSLYLSFWVDRRSTNLVPEARPGRIMRAAGGLRTELNLPYEDVLAVADYPKGTVLYDAVKLQAVRDAAIAYAILKRIEVFYDFIEDPWSAPNVQGFHIRLVLGESRRNDLRGKQLLMTVVNRSNSTQGPAGRSPELDHTAELDHPDQEVYGEFKIRGSTSWNRTSD